MEPVVAYVTLVGGGVSTSIIAGNTMGEDGKFEYKAPLVSSSAATASSLVSNSIIESNYHDAINRYKTETTEAYVQQLSDEELENALMKFGLLETYDKESIKVL